MKKSIAGMALVIIINSLYGCSSLRYGIAEQSLYMDPDASPVEDVVVYRPSADKTVSDTVKTTTVQEIRGYVFRLFLEPEQPRVNENTTIDLAVQDAKTHLPVKDLIVGCKAIKDEYFFITQCNQPYQKDSMNHHSMVVVYPTAGEWQLRFEIKTPDGSFVRPSFKIFVNE